MGLLLGAAGDEHRLVLSPECIHDLMLAQLMSEFCEAEEGEDSWTSLLTTDGEVIRQRNLVIQDLLAHPEVAESIRKLYDFVRAVCTLQASGRMQQLSIEVFSEFSLIKQYRSLLNEMSETLSAARDSFCSPQLGELLAMVQKNAQQNFSYDFETVWRELASGVEEPQSFTFLFRLDEEGRVESGGLAAVHGERYKKALLGGDAGKDRRQPCKVPDLQTLDKTVDGEYNPSADRSHVWALSIAANEYLKDHFTALKKQFHQYLHAITSDFIELRTDLSFYLHAVEYCRTLEKHGAAYCFAQIEPMETKSFRAEGLYYLPLLRQDRFRTVVQNDIAFQEGGELFILTGRNQGGKTTFLRSVGMAQVLFQLGWPVPANGAAISPVADLVTVFSQEEDQELHNGKLGQELKAVRRNLEGLSKDGMILLNEPITGTSPMENLYISRVVLCSLKVKAIRGSWVTHIYDLASGAAYINETVEGSRVSSLTVLQEDDVNKVSYKVVRGEPGFYSYARELLYKIGDKAQ